MPPQPYKSRRCLNCRHKKKSRPECGRCLRSKHPCQGYDYEVRIVSDGKSRQKMLDLAAKTTAAAAAAATMTTTTTAGYSLARLAMPTYRAALWMQFEARFLGWSPGWTGHSFQWVSGMDDSMRERTPATALATTALPLILVAQDQADASLLQDGMHMYSQAAGLLAREMQMSSSSSSSSSLLSPKQKTSSLVACLAMLSIEMMVSDGSCSFAWLTHVSGIAGLLARANPKLFQSGEMHPVFLYCRTTIITIALVLEAPLFLADEAWMTVPFLNVRRDVHTRLCDVLVHVPSLLHQATRFAIEMSKASSCERQSADKKQPAEHAQVDKDQYECRLLQQELLHSELIHRYSVVSQQLQAWHDSLDDSWMSSKTHEPLPSWPGYAYTFASAGHANVWTTYWMAQLGLHKVAARARSASPWFALQYVEKGTGTARRAADSICASAAYCADSKTRGARSVMFYTVPMRMAIEFYRMVGMADEADEALDIAQGLTQCGLAVARSVVVENPLDGNIVMSFQKATR